MNERRNKSSAHVTQSVSSYNSILELARHARRKRSMVLCMSNEDFLNLKKFRGREDKSGIWVNVGGGWEMFYNYNTMISHDY